MKKLLLFLLLFISQYSFSTETPHHRYFCSQSGTATYTIADIDLINIYNNTSYSWYAVNDSTSTPLTTSEILVNNAVYYYIKTLSNGTIITHSFTIHIEDTIPAPILDYGNYFNYCESDYYTIADLPWLTAYNYNNDLIYWFTANDNTGTPLGQYDEINYAQGGYTNFQLFGFLSLDDCTTSSVILNVNIEENLWQYVYGTSPQYFLSADNPTVSDIVATNWYNSDGLTYWYIDPYDYNSIPSNTPLYNNEEYYGYPLPENYYYRLCNYYADHPITTYLDHNSIKGKILFDYNNDGCDTNDVVMQGVTVTSTNGTNTFITSSTDSGNFTQHITNSLGDFTTTLNVPYYFDVSPNPLTSTFNQYDTNYNTNSFTGDFCLTANQTVEDVNIDILTNPIRPGFNTGCSILFKNRGTQEVNGTVTFNYDDSKLAFLSTSGTIVSQTANSITFSYANLIPFETKSIYVSFNAFQPPTTNIGDMVSFSASIMPIVNDLTPDNNTIAVNRTVVDSYDPNDITCVEGESIQQNEIDKFLHYIIRFENTGTANAINIKVENQLDTKLDWSTFEMISSSHNNRVEMKDGAISYIFPHINLPHTSPQSQGYIYYKIKPKQDVVLGDVFNNQAHIYFDYNSAIDTNIASTTIVNTLEINQNTALDFSVYPIPTDNILHIKSKTKITQIEIYNKLGQLIIKNTTDNEINISNLTQGFYFVKVKDINDNFGIKKIVKR